MLLRLLLPTDGRQVAGVCWYPHRCPLLSRGEAGRAGRSSRCPSPLGALPLVHLCREAALKLQLTLVLLEEAALKLRRRWQEAGAWNHCQCRLQDAVPRDAHRHTFQVPSSRILPRLGLPRTRSWLAL